MEIYLDCRIQVVVDVEVNKNENARDELIDEGMAKI